MPFWLIAVAVGVALTAAAFFLRPRPPRQQPREFAELEQPTSGAGQPIRKVYGTGAVKPHVLWFGQKNRYVYQVTA